MMVLCGQGRARPSQTSPYPDLAGISRIWTEIDDVSKCHVINLAAPHFKCEFKMPLLQSPALAASPFPQSAAVGGELSNRFDC